MQQTLEYQEWYKKKGHKIFEALEEGNRKFEERESAGDARDEYIRMAMRVRDWRGVIYALAAPNYAKAEAYIAAVEGGLPFEEAVKSLKADLSPGQTMTLAEAFPGQTILAAGEVKSGGTSNECSNCAFEEGDVILGHVPSPVWNWEMFWQKITFGAGWGFWTGVGALIFGPETAPAIPMFVAGGAVAGGVRYGEDYVERYWSWAQNN